MTIKILFFTFGIIFTTQCYSQKKISHNITDAEGKILFAPLSNHYDSVKYHTLDENVLTAYDGLAFGEGKDSLLNYVKAIYYRQKPESHEELNQRVVICLLIDKNMHVCEIRILPPGIYYLPEFYKALFSDILTSTSGKWIPIKYKDKKWFYHIVIINRIY